MKFLVTILKKILFSFRLHADLSKSEWNQILVLPVHILIIAEKIIVINKCIFFIFKIHFLGMHIALEESDNSGTA